MNIKPGTIIRINKEIVTKYPGTDKPDEVIPADSVGVIMWHCYGEEMKIIYFAKFFKSVNNKVELSWGSDVLPGEFSILMEA